MSDFWSQRKSAVAAEQAKQDAQDKQRQAEAKDAVLAEMVRFIERRRLNQVSVAWEYCPTLTEKLQAFARIVVLADWLFTATAAVAQPITGYLLARSAGWSLSEGGMAPTRIRSKTSSQCRRSAWIEAMYAPTHSDHV